MKLIHDEKRSGKRKMSDTYILSTCGELFVDRGKTSSGVLTGVSSWWSKSSSSEAEKKTLALSSMLNLTLVTRLAPLSFSCPLNGTELLRAEAKKPV